MSVYSTLAFYRAMHFSAKCGHAIACHPSVCPSVRLSVCNVGGSGAHNVIIQVYVHLGPLFRFLNTLLVNGVWPLCMLCV